MKPADLVYAKLKDLIAPVEKRTGLGESAAFLTWFLESVYRLEETDSRDAVCDQTNDKGIDGVYVDHNNEEVHFFQAKIRQQANGRIGDVGPKNLMASVHQFSTAKKIDKILAGNAHADLKQLINRIGLADVVAAGYKLIGVYVTNELHNDDSKNYADVTPRIRIYDRAAIAARVVDVDTAGGKKGSFTFDTTYVDPMKMQSGTGQDKSMMYLFPAQALQLVHMDGISDGSLFKENVRYTLGNTAVNKSIRKSIAEKKTHRDFVLFHNGIIILCTKVSTRPGELTIKDYSVVNGAQSLTSFFADKSKLTSGLRVLVRVVVVQDEALAKTITANSNNQNAIRPRDLRSNHAIMVRLQKEMSSAPGKYFFEIKRGEQSPTNSTVITNDEIGRALLSFDLEEPWSAHQIYKVFDEKYADIFGRPEVTASRVIFVHKLLAAVDGATPLIKNKPMASYTLTRFFVLYLLARILRENSVSKPFAVDPTQLNAKQTTAFLTRCSEILKTVVVDLNFESNEPDFDYKTILKSPKQSAELALAILASYEKDVQRDKAESFNNWIV